MSEHVTSLRAAAEPPVVDTMFQRGDLVWCKTDDGFWTRGIATDVFRSPVTGVEVVVVHGNGYYTENVVPDPGQVPEPQSIRA